MKSKFVSLILLFLLCPIFAKAASDKLAVRAARIYIGNGRVIENGQLLLEKGKIIGTTVDHVTPEGYALLDFREGFILPGLIDSHTHFGELPYPNDIRTSDLNESSQSLTPMVDIQDALNYWKPTTFDIALAAGVTTVVVLPGSSNVIGGIGTVVKTAGKDLAKRLLLPEGILKIALGENPKSAGKRNNRVPLTRMGVRFLLWKSFQEARTYKEKWDSHNQNPAEYPKPDLDLSKEPLRKALERKMRVHFHCARADDLFIACDLAKEFGLDISLDHVYEGYSAAEELAKRGIPVITGPDLSGWQFGVEPEFPINVSGILADAGVKVAIMSDGIDFCDLLLQASYAVKLGMKETDALKSITLHAAEIAKVDQRVGSLEAGKDADFVVINGPPFEVTTRVISVYIEGKEVFKESEGR